MDIDLSNHGLTGVLDLSDRTDVKEVECSSNRITKLILPPGVEVVRCYSNLLTHLDLPSSVKKVYCSYNLLTHLDLPTGIIEVYCFNNQLTELIIPAGVKIVRCSNNQLSRFVITPGFKGLITYDGMPLHDWDTRVSLLNSPCGRILVKRYYISHPYLENSDKLTMRNQLALLGVKQKWLNRYWRPNGPKSRKLMRESMDILCKS